MQTLPAWLQQAFCDWLTRRLYLDGGGNYRLRPFRRIASYNRDLKRVYPNNLDFHHATHLWLTLWEAVPTAKLRRRTLRDQLRIWS